MKLARSHSFYHAKGLGLFAVPCQSIAKLYTANVGHLKGAAQVRHKRARRYSRKARCMLERRGKEKEFKDVTGVMEGVQSYFDRDVSSCCTALSVDAGRSGHSQLSYSMLRSNCICCPSSSPSRSPQVVAQVFFFLTWPLTYLSQRQKYWTLVDSHVLLGAASTAFLPHVDAPAACGVDAVVNLRDEYACPMEQYKRHHIQQLQLPTVDHFSPSLEALTAAVAFI
uniref:Uncharacterized protein n=1 Tax=Peronospora matthiolae TaxID=2874970 RepID=A0AAV1U9G5_9STRA